MFFSAANSTEAEQAEKSAKNSAIYYKSVPKSGDVTREMKMIASSFVDVVAIGAFNSIIYVADSAKGFFAIEIFEMDFSEPRPL